MRSQELSLPVLERPSVRLFSKEGKGGGRELVITTQLQANIEADGECACVPVFVQSQSEHKYLLDMNILPALGLTLSRENGELLIMKEEGCEGRE